MDKIISKLSAYWKWIALVVSVVLTIWGWVGKFQAEKRATNIETFAKKSLDSTVKYWSDKNGREHAQIEKDEALQYFADSHYIDSLSKLLKIKPKNIQAVAQVRTQTKIDVPLKIDSTEYKNVPCPPGDSIKVPVSKSFSWSNRWTRIEGKVGIHGDSIHYSSTDTMTVVDYWKRDKVLFLRIGKDRGYVDYSYLDSNNHITGAKKIELHPPERRYSVGIGVQIGYPVSVPITGIKPQISVGITISRTLIKF